MTVRTTTLDNGLRVVTHAMAHLETVAIGLWVGSGARHERDGEQGIAHFLEHMAFKGTKRRSARRIAEEIEAIGGEINAATSMEQTAYFARSLKGDAGRVLDVLADILLNPVFDSSEIAREREVIAQEIGAKEDNPDDLAFEAFQQAAFPGQPLGRSILGTLETIDGFGRDHLEAFRLRNYRPATMVLSAAGGLDHDEIVDRTAALFAALPHARAPAPAAARFAGGMERREKPLEQCHLVFGFEGVGYHHRDYYATHMLASILGGGMSSRLFQEVREKRGLCYSIYAFASGFAECGLLGIHAATGPESLGEIVPVIAGELHGLAATVREDELARARAQLKTGLLMSLESAAARAEQMARQTLAHGRVLDSGEIIAKVEKIDARHISTLLETLVCPQRFCGAAIGPLGNLEASETLMPRFSMNGAVLPDGGAAGGAESKRDGTIGP